MISQLLLRSDSPADIDLGIRSTITQIQVSILAVGKALAGIKAEKAFIELGYKNITAYMDSLANDHEMDSSTLFRWLSIGEVYRKYREELEITGFNDKTGATKLPFLEEAFKNHPKDEVINNLMIMSLRKFENYAKSGNKETLENPPYWEERGNTFFLRGEPIISIKKEIKKRAERMLKSSIRVGLKALKRRGCVVAVHLNNKEEQNAFIAEARIIKARIQAT